MKKYILSSMAFLLFTLSFQTQSKETQRIEQLTNERVKVWKTIIYPSSRQILPMHRHDHDRVAVALTDGILKITNNKGKVRYMTLKKDQAYYLAKDSQGELHNDENMTNHSIKIMIIELS